ncbi:glycosyltransferase involved in cell wall biosynthesis [Aquimarina sp. MAR_2010_214]|uniref:glycosyltransferase family 4 protein n=1 Tax=Aquimarina sp. MAR_2010_214 TaxID=1250026 RepID=UPI000C701132|nr:glycosyltransferase family 4 protein [Aquimarina sp. MAR_2010_214]PKV48239.1 glycosyltransferase involved in cell wall biosynthesis [Aquimarina sp. MAR_2010_214]
MMTKKSIIKNNIGIYLNSYPPVKEGETIFGRDIAVNDFLKGLLLHGKPRSYQFYQTFDFLKNIFNARKELLDISNQRGDISITINDINDLKVKNNTFDFDIWHETDADFSKAVSLRERYSAKAYPISATFHVLSYQYLLHDWYLEILLKKIHDYDTIICTSTAAQKALHTIFDHVCERLKNSHNIDLGFKGDTEVIPIGIDTTVFKPRDKKELRHKLGLPLDAFIILWIGRISPLDKADLLPLLIILQNLIKENPEKKIRLVLGGTGEVIFNKIIDECIRDRQLNDHVILIRPLPTSERHLYHSCADVFVSPADNIQETFGITPIEAMASGVPQVVSDWNGYKDTVQHGETGFLIPTYMSDLDEEITIKSGIYDNYNLMDHFEFAQTIAIDLEAYQKALQMLLDFPSLCSQMSKKSRERALKIYDWKNSIYLHEQLWEKQLERASKQNTTIDFIKTYEIPAFYKNFNHYASKKISNTTQIILSEQGKKIANKEQSLISYYDSFNDLSIPVLYSVISNLHECVSQEFGALKKQIKSDELSLEKVSRHIMWLLKYGYVKILND